MKKILILFVIVSFGFSGIAQKCNTIDFSAIDIGNTHNSILSDLMQAGTREKMNAVILNLNYDPSELNMDKRTFLQKIEDSYFEMKRYGTDVNSMPDYLVSANVKPFLIQLVNATASIQSLSDYNTKLDNILLTANSQLTCLDLDQLKATITISKNSAYTWAPKAMGGQGFYDTYSSSNLTSRRWWESAIYGDMMGAMGAVHALGIFAVVGGAFTPGANVVILVGIGVSAGLGSAYGAGGL